MQAPGGDPTLRRVPPAAAAPAARPSAPPEGRLPELLFGVVALFAALHFLQGLFFPQQAYPEWAPRQFLLMMAIGLVAAGAMRAARFARDPRLRGAWRSFGAAVGALSLFAMTALPRDHAQETPLAVTWPATAAQMVAAFVVGFALVVHHRRFGLAGGAPPAGGPTRSDDRLGRLVGALALGLTLFLVADALHQHLVRLPRHYLEFSSPGPAALAAGGGAAPVSQAAGDPSGLHGRMLHALATGRVSSRLGNPNLLAAALVILWPLGALGALAARRRAGRVVAGAIVLVAVPAVLALTGSRGGVLTFSLVAAMTGVWLAGLARGRGGRRPVLVAVALLLLGTGLGAGLRATAPIARLHAASLAAAEARRDAAAPPALAARGSTIRQRVGFLRAALALLPEAGARGLGGGGFALHFLRVQPPRQQESQYVHDWPLQVLVEQGWIGLVALLTAIGAVGAGCLVLLRPRSRAADDSAGAEPAARLAVAALIAFAAFHLNGLVEITTYHTELALLGWLLGGVALGAAPRRDGDGPRPSAGAPAPLDGPASASVAPLLLRVGQVASLAGLVLCALLIAGLVGVPLEARRRGALAAAHLDAASAILDARAPAAPLSPADRAALEDALLAASRLLDHPATVRNRPSWRDFFEPGARLGAGGDRERFRLAESWVRAGAATKSSGARPPHGGAPPPASAELAVAAERDLIDAWWSATRLGRSSIYRLPSIHLDAAEFLLGPAGEAGRAAWLRLAAPADGSSSPGSSFAPPGVAARALVEGALARGPNHPPTLRRAAALLRRLGAAGDLPAALERHADACDLEQPPAPPASAAVAPATPAAGSPATAPPGPPTP